MGLVLNRELNVGGVVLLMPDGTRVVVRINAVRGKKVSLDFEAPATVKILRTEVEQRTTKPVATGGEPEMVLSGLHASGQATAS